MRPLLALCISAAILGGLWLYTAIRDSQTVERVEVVDKIAAGEFRLEVTPTCDLGADPAFAVNPQQATALSVIFAGQQILLHKAPITAGTTLRSEPIPNVLQGRTEAGKPQPGVNEFNIEASPAEDPTGKPAALRIRMLRDGVPIPGSETILWAEPGQAIQGKATLLIPATSSDEQHEH